MQENNLPSTPQNVYYSLNPETDKLLQKWLKMQISQYYLSMVTRVIIFVLVTTSIIISIVTLGPLMEKLLGPLATYQSLLNGNTNLPVDGSATKPASVNDIINQITPEQRQQVDNLLNH